MAPKQILESQSEDEQLVSNGLQGDAEAFNVLFLRYRRVLYRLAYHILRNHEESDDAVQNCLLLAFSKLVSKPQGHKLFPETIDLPGLFRQPLLINVHDHLAITVERAET